MIGDLIIWIKITYNKNLKIVLMIFKLSYKKGYH